MNQSTSLEFERSSRHDSSPSRTGRYSTWNSSTSKTDSGLTWEIYRMDKRLRLEKNPTNSGETLSQKLLEEGVIRLAEIYTKEDFYEVVSDTFRSILDSVVEVLVFSLDPTTNQLSSTGSLNHPLPSTGICQLTMKEGCRKHFKNVDPEDPLCQLLATSASLPPEQKRVICSPIRDRHSKKTVLFVAMLCNELSADAKEKLDYFERHVAATCYRLAQLDQLPTHNGLNTPFDEDSHHIFKLCGELYDRDGELLQQKLLHFLQDQLDCQHCLLFFVAEDGGLFARYFGADSQSQDISFPTSSSSFGTALLKKEPVNLAAISQADREKIEEILDCKLQSMICLPVESRTDQQVIALFCAFNKKHGATFSGSDEHKINHTFRYTSTVLTSTLAYQKERRLKTQTEIMLQVAKKLFSKLEDMTDLLKLVMQEARSLTNAERCSLFLLDTNKNELVAKVFDGGHNSDIRIPADAGIAGHVATTGELLNIKDAYEHPLFYKGVDVETGFRTKAILCFPIQNEAQIIGVAELCNKCSGDFFTSEDVEVAKAFSIYCAIAIAHSLLYKKVEQAQKKIRLTNELMLYHMQNVTQEDVCTLSRQALVPAPQYKPDIDRFHYNVRSIPDHESVYTVLTMFEDMDWIRKWELPRNTLVKFCLTVKQGYRESVPYHNWYHAFSVAHFSYLCAKNFQLSNFLDDLEIFSLFVSCLCHDIDHRGTNNTFEVQSESTLAALYSSEGSVMERHHFSQTVAILNSEGCEIFQSFSQENYKRIVDLIQNNILATDLAHHFRILTQLKEMSEGYNYRNSQHHELLLCLLMTSSDISDQTKDWKNLIHIAELLYKEFFRQGDLERALEKTPDAMMDRKNANIPEQQISFVQGVVLPVFELLKKLFPEAEEVYEATIINRERWDIVKEQCKGRCILQGDKLDIQNIDTSSAVSRGKQIVAHMREQSSSKI